MLKVKPRPIVAARQFRLLDKQGHMRGLFGLTDSEAGERGGNISVEDLPDRGGKLRRKA